MAEARVAARSITAVNRIGFEVDTSVKKAQLSITKSGLVLYIPAPYYIVKGARRSFWRGVDKVQFAFYPVPLSVVTSFALGVFVWVYRSPPESWVRSGKLASILWSIDELNPIAHRAPAEFRVPMLMANLAVGCVVAFTKAQRFFLRQLLKYKKWIYERGKPSRTTFVWCFLLRTFFFNRLEKTEAYQSCLPAQPLPKIKDTVKRFLVTMEPLLKDKPEEWATLLRQAEDFLNCEGPTLQRYLFLKYLTSDNYMTDWWLNYVYLSGRESLCINSNWFGIMFTKYTPSPHQASRAASAVYTLMKVKKMLDKGSFKPQFGGLVPLCMEQYTRVFGTTRIPGREQDVLVQYDDTKHIVVIHKGRFYRVQVLHPTTNKVLTAYQLEAAFEAILHADHETDPAEALIPALTAAPRQTWADIRNEHFINNVYNSKSLALIERAQMVVCLDEQLPASLDEEGKQYLCGSGCNRWSDKSMNLVILPNGKCGMHVEHSWGDALTMAEVVEYCTLTDEKREHFTDDGHIKPLPEDLDAMAKDSLRIFQPLRIRFAVDRELKKCTQEAFETYTKEIDNLELHILRFGEYGKNLAKKSKCSPDAWIQMAMQLAYYRDQGNFDQTYEAATLRMYLKGRTETIRTVSNESCAWVLSMNDPKVTAAERLALLVKACARHQKHSHDCVAGKGVDRHLFALYCVSSGKQIPSEFLTSALKRKWKLSTSQVLTRQLPAHLHLPEEDRFETSNGGFGPVADDGYGVSYSIYNEDRLFFTVTSKRDCPTTSSTRFAEHIKNALLDMRAIATPSKP